ncbi:MAG: phosphoribosylanthranilate isomerase [Lachnospiraceae bacterium]|nr:phosphoribosylanthranilate isomerase [Lachnospiraceae bacterium]
MKICGLTREEEVRWVMEEKADYLGMVLFFPKSKRNISIEQAKRLLAICQEQGKPGEDGLIPCTVAVTVSPTPEQVRQIEQAGFAMIQIHGELSAETYEAVTLPIIRAVQAGDVEEHVHRSDGGSVDTDRKKISGEKIVAWLYDAHAPGSGKAFDWNMLQKIPRDDKLLFLAGGLNSENVREAIAKVNPDVVDVSSGVEIDAETVGKDRNKIKEFVRKVEKDE